MSDRRRFVYCLKIQGRLSLPVSLMEAIIAAGIPVIATDGKLLKRLFQIKMVFY